MQYVVIKQKLDVFFKIYKMRETYFYTIYINTIYLQYEIE